jgi:hypothetical protein
MFIGNTSNEKSSVPIGVIDNDHSSMSQELVQSLKSVDTFYVYEKDWQSIYRMLKKDMVDAVFVIKEGYEEQVRSGDSQKLVELYYLSGNNIAVILSDIVAGEMMSEICYNQALNIFRTYELSDQTHEKFEQYAKDLVDANEFEFKFDMKVVDTGNQNEEVDVTNRMMYQQILVGFIAIIISFAVLFASLSIVKDAENAIQRRFRLTSLTPYIQLLGNTASIFTVGGFYALVLGISSGFVFRLNGTQFIEYCVLLLWFAGIISLLFVILSKLGKDSIRLQLAGVSFILFSGIIGFAPIYETIITNKLLNIKNIIPNCWLIEGFIDIIENGDFNRSIHSYGIITGILLLIGVGTYRLKDSITLQGEV